MPGAGQFADGLNNAIGDLPLTLEQSEVSASLQRIAQVPIYFSDALVRRAASLQMTKDSAVPAVRLAKETIEKLGLSVGEAVRVIQNAGQAVLEVEVDDAVPAGCARVLAGHAGTAMLGDMFGVITVERA
jgi:NADH-quinone oxidoreductase subunit G